MFGNVVGDAAAADGSEWDSLLVHLGSLTRVKSVVKWMVNNFVFFQVL